MAATYAPLHAAPSASGLTSLSADGHDAGFFGKAARFFAASRVRMQGANTSYEVVFISAEGRLLIYDAGCQYSEAWADV